MKISRFWKWVIVIRTVAFVVAWKWLIVENILLWVQFLQTGERYVPPAPVNLWGDYLQGLIGYAIGLWIIRAVFRWYER